MSFNKCLALPTYQCSDDLDNDEDGLIDTDDPGCHTDGDATNEESYDPTDDDETNEEPICTEGETTSC